MSYQPQLAPGQMPPEPETTPLGAPTGPQPATPTPLLDALIARNLAGIPAELRSSMTPLEGYPSLPNPDPNSSPPLYGEPPGEGYLYARDPETRQRAMVETNPDVCRDMLLRAMETAAQNALLPFNETDVEKQGRAALAFAQAYLLIDPSVDAEGVNVAHKAAVGAMGQMAVNAAQPQPQTAGAASATKRQLGGKTTVGTKGPTVGQHAEPLRIETSKAGEMLREMHQNAEAVLKGARGALPRPRPRVGA
jgi:hypothetical protein